MGERTKDEKLRIKKMMKYVILKQINDNGLIKTNGALYELNDELANEYDLLHQPKQSFAVDPKTFDGRYREYCRNIYRFKIDLPEESSYSHILLFPSDVLYLLNEKKIKLSLQQILFLIRPEYHYIDSKQLIIVIVRFPNHTPYFEKYLSSSKRICFASKSLNGEKYLIQFYRDDDYDSFKAALINRKRTRKRQSIRIQKKLQQSVEIWQDSLKKYYNELHGKEITELKKSIDGKINM